MDLLFFKLTSNLFLKLKHNSSYVIVLLCFLNSDLFYSQDYTIKIKDSVDIYNIIETLKKDFISNNLNGKKKFYIEIKQLEKDIIKTKNSSLILNYYIYTSDFAINIADYELAFDLLNKGIKIAKEKKQNRVLGLFYQALGIYYNRLENYTKGNKMQAKSLEILKKFGTDFDMIDVYYNLAWVQKRFLNWDKTLLYALKSKEYITKLDTMQGNNRYLNLFIAESLIELNRVKEVPKYFHEIETDKRFRWNDDFFCSKYYRIRGLYFTKIKDYSRAEIENKKNYETLNKLKNFKNPEVEKMFKIKKELLVSELNNINMKNENEIQSKNIKNKNYAILLSIFLFFLLIYLLIIQHKNSKYISKLKNKLREKNIKLLSINQKATEAIKQKKDFIDIIVHELRTPLNTIKSVNYLLSKNLNDEDKKSNSELLNFSSDYLLNLVDNIKNINSLYYENDINNMPHDIIELIENIIATLKIKKDNTNKIYFDYDENISRKLMIDSFKISGIFINLISNAIKFTKEGEIKIITKLIENNDHYQKIYFSVCDNGIGISDEIKHTIFELFNQGSKEINTKYGGTGIGLYLVKETLKKLNSDILLKSELGKGSEFSFSIAFLK